MRSQVKVGGTIGEACGGIKRSGYGVIDRLVEVGIVERAISGSARSALASHLKSWPKYTYCVVPPILTGGSAPEKKPRLPKQVSVDSKACHAGNAKNSKDTPRGALLRIKLALEQGRVEGIVYVVCALTKLVSTSNKAASPRTGDNIVTGTGNPRARMRDGKVLNHACIRHYMFHALHTKNASDNHCFVSVSYAPKPTSFLITFVKMAGMRGRLRHSTAMDRFLVTCPGYSRDGQYMMLIRGYRMSSVDHTAVEYSRGSGLGKLLGK